VISKDTNKLLERLEEEKKRGATPRFFDLFQKLFRLQAETEKKAGKAKPGMKKEEAAGRLMNGIPLLEYQDIAIDWPLLNRTYESIIAIFAEYPDVIGELPASLKQPGSQPLLSREMVRAWYAWETIPSDITPADTRSYLMLDTLIHSAMKPFLSASARALIGLVNQDEWLRLRCPICGGKPDIAYLSTEYGARWLVCSRCDTEWRFQRLQCPYCGNENQNELSYWGDDAGIYRLYTCEKCHSYIKAIDTRNAGAEVLMPLERILTLDLDRQAQEKGYHPGHFEEISGQTG
jgi:hypothetical protein